MPTDGKAVTQWPNHDAAFNDVADGVRRLAAAIQQKGVIAAAPADAGAKPAVGQLSQEFADKLLKAEPAPVAERDLEPRPDDAPRNRVIADLAVFREVDAPWRPELVALPAGEFLMGSPEKEEGRWDAEGPQHEVTIGRRFGIGRYPVTFDEYDHFCAAIKREKLRDQGWGRGRRPVIGVSWRDALDYCQWLAKETGQPYRLPSEAEWEYACRAGTTTRYSWGNTITPKDANYGESKSRRSARPPRLVSIRRTHGACTTCMATSGSGSRTSGTTATEVLRPMARRGRMEKE